MTTPTVWATTSDPSNPSELPVSRFLAAITGVVAGAAGVATAGLIASTSRDLRSPILDVGDRVVDNVPGWLKDIAIAWFGTNDKIALLVGIGVALTLFAAALGLAAIRGRVSIAYAGAALFGIVGAVGALASRTGRSAAAVLPSLGGAAVVCVVFFLARRASQSMTGNPGSVGGPALWAEGGRRRFLAGLGGLTVASATTGAIGNRLDRRFSAASSRETVLATQGSSGITEGPPAVPAGAQAENAALFFTPNEDFYRIDTALVVPQVPADSWRLRVTGMVDNPIELTYEDLVGRGLVESDITLTCVSNLVGGGLVGTARWQGVRLDELLQDAGVQAGADQIVGRSVDGYTCGFPVAALDGRDALVAVSMNGEPLPLEHGFPARLIVPGIYGYASATKWLTEIELTTFDSFDHYWVPRGYSALAPIKMQTRIDAPRGLDRIAAGRFAIGGVAWSQPVGIKQVELKIDDGPWIEADMAAEVNGSTWRQWSHVWDATPGRHTITARAIDQDGAIQTADRTEPLPNGATGHHSVVVLVDEA